MVGWNILGCNMLPMPYNQVTVKDSLFMESNGVDDMFPVRVLNTTAYTGKLIFIKLLFLKNNVSKPMNRMCDMIGLLIILAEAMKLLLNIRKFYFCIIINFKNN